MIDETVSEQWESRKWASGDIITGRKSDGIRETTSHKRPLSEPFLQRVANEMHRKKLRFW